MKKVGAVQGCKQICCHLHALRKPRNKVTDVAGLLESSGGDLRPEDDSLPCSIKSDTLLFRLPFPLNWGFQSCKPVLDAGHDADVEEVLGVVGGGVAAKAELPSCFLLQCRCLRRALSPSPDTSLAWSARRLEMGVDVAGEGNLEKKKMSSSCYSSSS